MDDVAGCRMIFDSIPALDEFRAAFHKARFRHKRKNDKDKYNYIKDPRSTGYRGIHDIYEYTAKTDEGKPYNGLLLELQFSTHGLPVSRLSAVFRKINQSSKRATRGISNFSGWRVKS